MMSLTGFQRSAARRRTTRRSPLLLHVDECLKTGMRTPHENLHESAIDARRDARALADQPGGAVRGWRAAGGTPRLRPRDVGWDRILRRRRASSTRTNCTASRRCPPSTADASKGCRSTRSSAATSSPKDAEVVGQAHRAAPAPHRLTRNRPAVPGILARQPK